MFLNTEKRKASDFRIMREKKILVIQSSEIVAQSSDTPPAFPERGEAEDAEVHGLEGEGLLALVEADAVEAVVGPVVLHLVPPH